MRYISWGVALLGLFLARCSDDDKADPVQPESLLTLTGTDIVFEKEGGTQSFKLSTNRGWAIVHNEGEWLEVDGEVLGEAGEHEITLKAIANGATESRKAKFTVIAGLEKQELEFTQFGSDPEVIAAPQLLKAPCDGASYGLIVHTNNAPLEIKADDWLTVKSSPFASAGYLYTVQVAGNTGAARSGKIVFSTEGAGATVTVEQAVYEKHYELSEKLNVSALAESAVCNVKANFDWKIEWPQGQPAWIKGVTPASGKKGETVKVVFTIDNNMAPGAEQRSAGFSILDGKVETITQAAPVISENGTRETDSLALVEFCNNLKGTKPDWDFGKPMNEWGHNLEFDPDGRVIGVELLRLTIEGELPAAITKVHLLRKLSFARLTAKNMKFPASFGELKQLQELNIACGAAGGEIELADMGGTTLYRVDLRGLNPLFETCETPVFKNVDLLANADKLEALVVEYANIGELPDFSGCPNFNTLQVYTSDVTRFPSELANSPKLRNLVIKSCSLTGELPDVFTHTQLASLDVSVNQMSGELPLAMFTSKTLMEVYVSDNNFTGNLPVELSTESKINQFSCRNNRMGGDGVMLPEEILKDERWLGTVIGGGGSGSGGWFGKTNICQQQPKYGWDNCN